MALILRPPGTPLSLAERLGGLAQWHRAWSVAGGMLGLVAFVALALTISFGLDFAFTLPAWLRALALSVLILGGVALAAVRIVRPWRNRRTPLDLALALEDNHPELNDSLASAVAFLKSPGDNNSFRDAAIRRAEALSEPVPWTRTLPLGRFWRSFWLAVLAGGALAAVAVNNSDRFVTGVARLFDPWGSHAWPLQTTIEIITVPDRIAIGETWTVQFKVAGEVPEAARVQVRTIQTAYEESISLGEAGHGSLTLDPSRTTAEFQFRILAGDAATDWRAVPVVPPPRLVPHEGRPSPRLRLEYPAYTGWSPLELPDGIVAAEAVAGTRIQFAAVADRALSSACLKYQGDLPSIEILQAVAPLAGSTQLTCAANAVLAEGFSAEIPVTVSGGKRRQLFVEFVPPLSGVYTLRFVDESGIAGQRLLDLRNFPDPAPTVTLLRPDPARDTLDWLLTGTILVDARADDRTFAVKSLLLEYRVGDELWQSRLLAGPEFERPFSALLGGRDAFAATHPPALARRERLRLAEFRHHDGTALSPGDLLTVRAAGTDWDDVSIGKEPGRSGEISLRLHSPQSLDAELKRQLVSLRDPLRKASDAQAAAAKAAADAKSDPAALATLEKNQNEVRDRIADPAAGLRSKANQLQQMLRDNTAANSAAAARLDAVARTLTRLDERLLPAVEESMAAVKQNPKLLADLASKQQAAAAELNAAAGELERWAGLAELQSDTQALAGEMRKAGEMTTRLREQVPAGVSPEKLSATDKAALEKAAAAHAAAASNLQKLLGKADKVREAKAADPEQKADVDKLEKALKSAGGSAAADQLREAADDLRDNRLTDAAANRAGAEEKVQAFGEALAGRETPDELRRRNTEQKQQLESLRQQQDELAKKMPDANDAPDELKKKLVEEQERLRRETEQLAERLVADNKPMAAEKLHRAAEQMEKAAGDLASQRDPAAAAQKAEQELQKAQDQLKEKKEAAPETLTREEQQKLLKTLEAFRDRQKATVEESRRLSAESKKAGRWERPLIASLAGLAASEDALAKEVRAGAKKLEDAPVFLRMLEQSAERMEQAAGRIRDRKDDALTTTDFIPENEAAADESLRQPMLEALRRLEQVVAALSEKPKPPQSKPTDQPMGEEPAKGQQPKPPPLAQLKALRDWQAEIQQRTAIFAKAHPDSSKLSDDERAVLADLQKAQQEIATLFETLRSSLTPMEAQP